MKRALIEPKVLKYVKARSRGLNKEKSRDIAGYSESTRPQTIEATEQYKAISVKDSLLSHISLEDITKRHKQLIQSDNEAVAINATKLAYDRIEPLQDVKDNDTDIVAITMK